MYDWKFGGQQEENRSIVNDCGTRGYGAHPNPLFHSVQNGGTFILKPFETGMVVSYRTHISWTQYVSVSRYVVLKA